MPEILKNPWRGQGIVRDAPIPATDPARVADLLSRCPAHGATPLTPAPEIAEQAGVRAVWIKDERHRMGLGSFKALGASFAIALEAVGTGIDDLGRALEGRVFVTASAGNHGLSVAAGARLFGAEAVIYIAETVPQAFADRLTGFGARVVRSGDDYDQSMQAAAAEASQKGWTLLSDSSWPGYTDAALHVMEGYLQFAAEAAQQMPEPPTHILLQAGVGGMAAAAAGYARRVWGDAPQIIVVEPANAPALIESIRAGDLITADGPSSAMGRLDCKTPSLVALAGLSRDADMFATITEDEAQAGVAVLGAHGFATTPSGGAGLAALLAGLNIGTDANVLTILSEGPEDV